MFLKELDLYINHFKVELNKVVPTDKRAVKYIEGFRTNLIDGIKYYEDLFNNKIQGLDTIKTSIQEVLKGYRLAIS